jgi:hypothetical protein
MGAKRAPPRTPSTRYEVMQEIPGTKPQITQKAQRGSEDMGHATRNARGETATQEGCLARFYRGKTSLLAELSAGPFRPTEAQPMAFGLPGDSPCPPVASPVLPNGCARSSLEDFFLSP